MEICKDIYETEELPEAEQDYDCDIKDCVETLNISVLSAFNRFKGKEVSLIKKEKKEKLREKHNPIDRAKRIIQELDALSNALKSDKDIVIANEKDNVSKEQLLILTEGLATQMRELDIDKYFGPKSEFQIEDPKNAIYTILAKKMDSFETKPSKSIEKEGKRSYSLIHQPNVNEYLNKLKMSNLLKRIEILEKVMGDNSVKLAGIVSDCPSKGLLEAVEKLTAKTALLNANQLSIIESRLNAVVNKLQNMSTVISNATPLDQESQMKVAELYELIKKHDPVMDTVSNIVEQCVSMQESHIKGAQLSQCLIYLEMKQHEVDSKLNLNQMVVKNIMENIPRNFETMENNIKLIETRLEKLHK